MSLAFSSPFPFLVTLNIKKPDQTLAHTEIIQYRFFVHQRSLRTGLTILTLTCLVSLVAIIGGPITENLGWRYLFIIYLPFSIVGAVAAFLFLPETQFRREVGREDVGPEESIHVPKGTRDRVTGVEEGSSPEKMKHAHVESGGEMKLVEGSTSTVVSTTEEKKTFVHELALFSGVYTETGLFKLFLAPFATLLNLSVVWVCKHWPWALHVKRASC